MNFTTRLSETLENQHAAWVYNWAQPEMCIHESKNLPLKWHFVASAWTPLVSTLCYLNLFGKLYKKKKKNRKTNKVPCSSYSILTSRCIWEWPFLRAFHSLLYVDSFYVWCGLHSSFQLHIKVLFYLCLVIMPLCLNLNQRLGEILATI